MAGRNRAARSKARAPHVRMLPAGEQGLVVDFGEVIDPAVNARVRQLARAVAARLADVVLEVVPTYRSLLVIHDPLRVPRARLASRMEALLAEFPAGAPPEGTGRVAHLPVCYGGEFGPDLDLVAQAHHLEPRQVEEIHAAGSYLVYMLGFTPGFPYLGGLSERIAVPRLDTPRTHVPAGSVGIAGTQTAIYPIDSPGGWRLIGRTPVRLFDPRSESPFLLAPGDRVRFVPVGPERYAAIASEVAAGRYAPELETPAGAGR
jgi:inhibitor of KinA